MGASVSQRCELQDYGPSPQLESAAPSILVVEDNELNMKLFNDLLSAHGYRVLKVSDGTTALQVAEAQRPDLVIMDIQLPGELSGLDVTKALKADVNLKSVPVIAVTAFAMKGDDSRIRDAGCDGYITKPISAANFLQTIQQYLREHGTAKG